MTKDKRYSTVKKLISARLLKSFSEIFDTIPKTVVAKDLGLEIVRFSGMIKDVRKFRVDVLCRLADQIGVDEKEIFDLIYAQLKLQRK
jgi:energy-converting hydrogenase A subunit M